MAEVHTEVFVLYILPGLPFRLDHIVSLFRQITDEHLLHNVSAPLTCDYRSATLTVATVTTNAALLEHWMMSSSSCSIRFTRETGNEVSQARQ